jgi:hypothetical protein
MPGGSHRSAWSQTCQCAVRALSVCPRQTVIVGGGLSSKRRTGQYIVHAQSALATSRSETSGWRRAAALFAAYVGPVEAFQLATKAGKASDVNGCLNLTL